MTVNGLTSAQLNKQNTIANFRDKLQQDLSNGTLNPTETAVLQELQISSDTTDKTQTLINTLTAIRDNISSYFSGKGRLIKTPDLNGNSNTGDDLKALQTILGSRHATGQHRTPEDRMQKRIKDYEQRIASTKELLTTASPEQAVSLERKIAKYENSLAKLRDTVAPATTTVTPATTTVACPVSDEKEAFVQSLYKNILGRNGEEQGVNYWKTMLGTKTPAEVTALFTTAANHEKDIVVQDFYKTMLGRTGEQQGVDYWKALIGANSRDQVKAMFAEAAKREKRELFITSGADTASVASFDSLVAKHVSLESLDTFTKSVLNPRSFWLGPTTGFQVMQDIKGDYQKLINSGASKELINAYTNIVNNGVDGQPGLETNSDHGMTRSCFLELATTTASGWSNLKTSLSADSLVAITKVYDDATKGNYINGQWQGRDLPYEVIGPSDHDGINALLKDNPNITDKKVNEYIGWVYANKNLSAAEYTAKAIALR